MADRTAVRRYVINICDTCRAGEEGPYVVGCDICDLGGPGDAHISAAWLDGLVVTVTDDAGEAA